MDESSSGKGAGPSQFQSLEDYIPFDFSGEDDEQKHSVRDSSHVDTAPALSKTAGKKRKIEHDSENGRTNSASRKRERRLQSKGTPWCSEVAFERCRSATETLHDELIAFANWISPTPREHETRSLVIELIRRAIVSQWRDADVQAFGSQNTQLYMPQGDIDLVVLSESMESQKKVKVLKGMAACLRRHNLASEVQVIAHAKVPIVKFVCTHGKLKVDISVNQSNGLDASRFVSDWLERCPSIRPLIMATKLLLNQRGMSEVFSGGLGSYSVICMVISHIQLHPKLQSGEIDPAYNLGVLFLELLELYGKNFGYDEVGISVSGIGKYFRKARRGWKDDRRPFMLSIEDPQDASNDISKGSFAILSVRQVFGGAFDILTAALCQRETEMSLQRARAHWYDENSDVGTDEDEEARQAILLGARSVDSQKDARSLLGTLFGVNYEMSKARRDLESLWQSGVLQNKVGRSLPPRSPEPADLKIGNAFSEDYYSSRYSRIDPTYDGPENHYIVDGHQKHSSSRELRSSQQNDEAVQNTKQHHPKLEDQDSRYASQKSPKATRSRLDRFSQIAPQTFVDEDSDANDESDAGSPPRISNDVLPKHKAFKGQSKRKNDFWASKGNQLSKRTSSEESNDDSNGLSLNIYS